MLSPTRIILEQLPEEKNRYKKMNCFSKMIYNLGISILLFRKSYKDNVLPGWYKELHGLSNN